MGTRLLVDALAFAAYKHRLQRRKDPEASPYINHPIALAHVLSGEAGVTNTRTLAAAILHDTIEDTETTYEELRERFGKTVAGVVREVSDDKTLPKAERKRLQIEHAEQLSRRARLVKLAEHLSEDIIELAVAFCSRRQRRILLAYFVPIEASERRIEVFLFHGTPNNIKGLLAHFRWEERAVSGKWDGFHGL